MSDKAAEYTTSNEIVRWLREDKERRDKWIGVYIGVLAVLLAIVGMGGGNASKDATQTNIQASNTWNFFQAKNLRRHALRLQADDLTLRLKTDNALVPEGRKLIEERIAFYRSEDARLTSEKTTGEGLDELFMKAKELEVQRDIALRKDPYFDYAQALLQIAIVLATVVLIVPQMWLLGASGFSGLIGIFVMLNAFFLFARIPGIE